MTPKDRVNPWPAIRNAFSILVVSMLIWLFAEAQSVSEHVVDVRVTISAPPSSGLVVTVDDLAWTGRASVRLQGARAAIDEASRELAAGVALLVGAPGVTAEPGRQIVDLRSALMSNPPLDRADVTIAAVEPRTLELRIDELVRLTDIPIRPELPGVQTVGDVQIDPPTAIVVLPGRVRDRLKDQLSQLAVTARLTERAINSLPEGGPQRHEARLSLPTDIGDLPGVRIEPQSALLTFTVRSTTESITVASVPVWPMAPPTDINRWEITVEPIVLRDVSLSGPSDVMQRIRSGELRVIATVVLSSDELEQRITAKAPTIFGLPDTVRIATPLEPVRLSITPIVSSSSPNGGSD